MGCAEAARPPLVNIDPFLSPSHPPSLPCQVFYLDSLKFFLSLYGHKLPVLCMDISSDSTLLVSGSADKNIKVWGLDFGDCHKSLFAHGDTVMQVGIEIRDIFTLWLKMN